MIRTAGRLVKGFFGFWYDFIVGDDWVAAAGVAVMIGGAALLLSLGITAWWFGPIAILATVSLTIRRQLRRQTGPC